MLSLELEDTRLYFVAKLVLKIAKWLVNNNLNKNGRKCLKLKWLKFKWSGNSLKNKY